MISIEEDTIDEILFDYFEGNLSDMDKEEVKRFIDHNPQYLEDFRLWEVSNVKHYTADEPFDSSLLMDSKSSYLKHLIIIGSELITASILVVLMLQPSAVNKAIESNDTLVSDVVSKNKTIQKQEPIRYQAKRNLTINNKNLLPEKSFNVFVQSQSDTIISNAKILTVDNLAQQKQQPAILEQKLPDSLTVENRTTIPLLKKTLSKREERKIERGIQKHKQKEKDQRAANKFLKGNKLYVVPLNPANF